MKKQKQKREEYKVTIFRYMVGNFGRTSKIFAPTIFTDCEGEKSAVLDAKSRSGLSRFPEWQFEASKIEN